MGCVSLYVHMSALPTGYTQYFSTYELITSLTSIDTLDVPIVELSMYV